jgi:VanZ family protein
MCLKIFRTICVLISVAIMVLIFSFSAQEAGKSSDTSGKFIASIVKTFTKDFDKLSAEEQKTIISKYQFSVRKLAHFSIFTALGFFVLLSLITYQKLKIKIRILLAFLISAVYAVSDEIHQLFVEGRSCELRDFGIDLCGCILGIIIALTVYTVFLKFKGRKQYVKKEIG